LLRIFDINVATPLIVMGRFLFISPGSGSPVAYGVLESDYKKDKLVNDNLKTAVRAIKVAQQRDSASGNGVTLATITSSGFKKFDKSDVETIIDSLN